MKSNPVWVVTLAFFGVASFLHAQSGSSAPAGLRQRRVNEFSDAAILERDAEKKNIERDQLQYEANERNLDRKYREIQLQETQREAEDAENAIKALAVLDPKSEDYGLKEAQTLAKYPRALKSAPVRYLMKANAAASGKQSPFVSPASPGGSTSDFDRETTELQRDKTAKEQLEQQNRQFQELKRIQEQQLELIKKQTSELERMRTEKELEKINSGR